MPTYKYTLKSGRTLWYASFYYIDWMGRKKRIVKRGFKTQREAKAYEEEFLSRQTNKSDIPFKDLVENYMEDMRHRLRETTIITKEHMIRTKLLPYFENQKLCDIDTVKIRKWQNTLLEMRGSNNEPYRETYLRSIHNQLSAILNYAVKHYGLTSNPCHAAGNIGKDHAEEMNIWTKEQFELFLQTVKTTRMRIGFEILFYSGIREGELLALAPEDFSSPNLLKIRKNYAKIKGEEMLTAPKTPKGNRSITIPVSLFSEVQDYIAKLYGIGPEDRIFEFAKSALYKAITNGADQAGLPRIRVHDLRHSNASMLINMGVDIMEISRRLGHESTKTTWDTYGHLYPDKENELAKMLESIRNSNQNNPSTINGGAI